MTIGQGLILGLLQGITELFPVSSLGHTVILPQLFGWHVDQHDPSFLLFIVATHLATSLVLLGFFFKDWVRIVSGILRSLRLRVIDEQDTYAKLGWLLIIGTIPAGILGLLFEDKLKLLFATPRYAAMFLALNGVLLYGAEILRRRAASGAQSDERTAQLSYKQTVGIGFMQSLALLPGFSRTGSTIAGGLLAGLHHEDAARFSFLLATPIILAAAVLKLPELWSAGTSIVEPIIAGSLCAAVGAYVSVRFLTRYFQTKTLTPFALYCAAFGLLTLYLLH